MIYGNKKSENKIWKERVFQNVAQFEQIASSEKTRGDTIIP